MQYEVAFVSLICNFLMFHQQSQYKNVDCIFMRGSRFVSFCRNLFGRINKYHYYLLLSQSVKDCQEILHIRPAFVSLICNFLIQPLATASTQILIEAMLHVLPKTRHGRKNAPAQTATGGGVQASVCLLYTSPSPRDRTRSRMPSSA